MGNHVTKRRPAVTKSFLSRQVIRSSGALYKFKVGHGPVSVYKPLNYSCIRDYFKSSFRGLVADISPFDTHSLRAGGASVQTDFFRDMDVGSLYSPMAMSAKVLFHICQCQKS